VLASFETRTEQILVQDVGEGVTYSAPKYEFTTLQQLVHEAYEKWNVEPAKFESRKEQVLVKEAGEELKYVAAQYEWTEEKVLTEIRNLLKARA
jgi:hypothetical protein